MDRHKVARPHAMRWPDYDAWGMPRPHTARSMALRARVVAAKSCMIHRHACFIVDRRGCVVAEACNQRVDWMKHGYSIHAEIWALRQASARISSVELRRCVMYVFRVCYGASGDVRLATSHPCDECVAAIEKARISRVYFSNE